MRLIKEYFRKDNMKTWGPIIVTLLGFVVPNMYDLLFSSNPVLYWILFAISIASLTVFLILSYKYVDRWHKIVTVLKRKNLSLFRTCSLLAVMEETKEREDFQVVNNVLCVSRINVTYKFTGEKIDEDGRYFYPFKVNYHIEGIAEGKGFNRLFFHLLAHKPKQLLENMEVKIGNSKLDIALEENYGDVQLLSFNSSHFFRALEPVDYLISMTYNGKSGLIKEEQQRWLVCPTNITNLFSPNVVIQFNVIIPKKISKEIGLTNDNFRIRNYTTNLKENFNVVPSVGETFGTANTGIHLQMGPVTIRAAEANSFFVVEINP